MTPIAFSFIWDTIRELRNFTDFGFIAHGAVCLAIYTNAFVSHHHSVLPSRQIQLITHAARNSDRF